ncbi:MAG: M23 family metallopeptidase [Clostridia bacterium]
MVIKISKLKNFLCSIFSKTINKCKESKLDKNDIYLLKYRFKNNDNGLRLKLKIILIFLILLLITIFCFMFKPFEKISASLSQNYENYRAEDHTIKIRKKAKETLKQVDYSKLEWPLSGQITSGYGYRTDPINGRYLKHTGIDISGKHRDFVKAVTKGKVSFVGSQNGFGNCIEIEHNINGDKFYSFYAHLSEIDIVLYQEVDKGQVIAKEGGDPRSDPNPGWTTGHHLHFEIRTSSGFGNDIDPYSKLN